MPAADCPFVASHGARPVVLAGRSAALDATTQARLALHQGTAATPLIFVGRVGSGRTALADELARQTARASWSPAVVTIDRDSNVVHEVARGIAAVLLRRQASEPGDATVAELLGTIVSCAAAYDLALPIDAAVPPSPQWSGDPADDLTYLFRLIGDAGRAAGTGYGLVIDDIDLATTAGAVETARAATEVAAAGLPLLVVFTGLPGTAALLGVDLAEHQLDPFGPQELTDAIVAPAAKLNREIPLETVASIGRRTRGHPYFVQALTRAAWEASNEPVITPDDVEAGSHAAEMAMMSEFFGPVLDELSPPERRFLRAMADVGANPTFAMMSRRLGDTDRFDRSRSSLAQIRDALLDRRVIYQVGDTLHYALPYFERYVRATA